MQNQPPTWGQICHVVSSANEDQQSASNDKIHELAGHADEQQTDSERKPNSDATDKRYDSLVSFAARRAINKTNSGRKRLEQHDTQNSAAKGQ